MNVRENRMSNQKWTIQVYSSHLAQHTERSQTKQKYNTVN
jgi:hypothetical protein